MQSPQAIRTAYYFDLAARDYILADGAIELVIEGVPCSAFIEPSQSCELTFGARLDRLRGRKHAADGGKFCRDLQEQSRLERGARKLPVSKCDYENVTSQHSFKFWRSTCYGSFKYRCQGFQVLSDLIMCA